MPSAGCLRSPSLPWCLQSAPSLRASLTTQTRTQTVYLALRPRAELGQPAEAEIGFLAFQVELLELSTAGPAGQVGKNNTRELISLSIWLEEPEGRLLLAREHPSDALVLQRQYRLLCSLFRASRLGGCCCPPFPTLLSTPGGSPSGEGCASGLRQPAGKVSWFQLG